MKDHIKDCWPNYLVLGIISFAVYSCNTSKWWSESQRETAAQEKKEQTPHIIRSADGCDVYAFKAGGVVHYFTRCADRVTTDRNYTENCGKNCTKKLVEQITTGRKP